MVSLHVLFFFAPQYVTLSEGFFKEEGLNVELYNIKGINLVTESVDIGNLDILLCGPETAIYTYYKDKADYYKIFAQVTKRDGSFLVSRKPEENFAWKNLQGKEIISGNKGEITDIVLKYVLKQNNLIPDINVKIKGNKNIEEMSKDFKNGKGDYISIFEPYASYLEKKDKGYIAAFVGRESGEIPYTVYMSKVSYLKDNSETIQKFTNALFKGQQWIRLHTPEEIAKSIEKYFPDIEFDNLVSIIKKYKEYDTWKTDPELKEEDLKTLQNIMQETGQLEEIVPYEKIVTVEYARNAFTIKE